jgi:hypothetical protein
MIEEAMRAPVSVGMLKINGEKIMATLQEQPSPRIGWILHALFDEVIECPELNTETYLEQRTLELSKISNEELKQKGEKGKAIKQIEEEKEVGEIRKKYGVK